MSLLLLTLTAVLFPAAPNPVLPRVADAGVFCHAGTYYIMGVGTSGGVYTSEDLVHWNGPTHVFSMDNAWTSGPSAEDKEIHACDLLLRNGVFHLYWSVNHGPLRQIGHAIADTPLGPFSEPVRDIPFDGRIDPQCFQDNDGRLYFYTVKFLNSNLIFGQPMASPWQLKDGFHFLLLPRLNSWETRDAPPTFINEGPFVTKYRSRYYMIYNANHTGHNYGNYALGVAESDTPLGFRNSGKYPFPVLRSNHDPKHEGIGIPEGFPEIKNAGQPNLIRGPNGIEWWLVYFADQKHRDQYIDRVHFFGHELFAEGPTCAATPGYHPIPAMPSFRDLFEEEETLETRWSLKGRWLIKEGALQVAESEGAHVLAKTPAARHYVLETTFRCGRKGTGRFGVVAWDNGRDSRLLIGLDREKNTAFQTIHQGEHKRERSIALPSDFNWAGPHTLRIENNDGAFSVYWGAVRLDMLNAPLRGYGPGRAGLFAEDCSPSFDSFVLTRGWDEWDSTIRGWRSLAGHPVTGGERGLTLRPGQAVFKGDPLRCYEFVTQIQSEGTGGIYPIYLDDNNYLRVSVNKDFTEIRADGKRQGNPIPEQIFIIRPRIHRAHGAPENGNNLRVVKLEDRVVLFAEGHELGEIKGDWPDARVGLFTEQTPCTFNEITLYELP